MISKNVEEYGACIIFLLLIPLLPVLLEGWFAKQISSQSLMITAAIYSVTVGNTSSSKLTFVLSIVIGITFSACYGIVMAADRLDLDSVSEILPSNSEFLAALSIVFILITSLVEKYAMYITGKEKCLDFD